MVETFTPAGCGGRYRQRFALTIFTVASILAAATVGAAVGWVGSMVPASGWFIGVAGCVVAIAALREAGVVRVPIPDLRRQVPEHWRRTLPLPAWASGYGVILGSGFGTYQPVATFWATLCAVAAVGRPMVGALCMALFGLARGIMVAIPNTRLLHRLMDAHRAVRPVNAVVLAVLAAALVPTAANAGPFPAANGVADPSMSLGNLAFTQFNEGATSAVVRTNAGEFISFPGGRTPSISGEFLAFADPSGVRIVRWRTGEDVARFTGNITKPALSGLRLVYVLRTPTAQRLVVQELATARTRTIARVSLNTDLGRPSIWGSEVVWHENDGGGHRILRHVVGSGRVSVLASSSRRLELRDPVVGHGRIAWIVADAEVTSIWVRRGVRGTPRRVATVLGPQLTYTNYMIGQRRLLISRWGLLTGKADIQSVRLPGGL